MKILFIYPKASGFESFIKNDAKILESKHEVFLLPFDRIRYDLLKLQKKVRTCELVFNWFCGLHALVSNLIAKLFSKKCVTVVGGYEVAFVPTIKYGQLVKNNNQYITKLGLKFSDLVINISNDSKRETIKNACVPNNKIKMIYHGFSEDNFKRNPEIEKKNLVITIGKISKTTIVKKGLDIFVKSAHFLPATDFLLIGPDLDGSLQKLKKISPPNVKFIGGLYGDDLSKVCNQAKVYVQASIHESFGCSVAEAMLCGCIPVVSNNAALPEVVGDKGIYFRSRNPKDLANHIKKALTVSHIKEEDVINRIRKSFSLANRKAVLLSEIEKLMI